MYADIAELLRRLGLWFLVNMPATADLAETVGALPQRRGARCAAPSPRWSRHYEAHDTEARIAELADRRRAAAIWPRMWRCCRFWARRRRSPARPCRAISRIDLVAGAYFAIGERVGLDRLRGLAVAHRRHRTLGPAGDPAHCRRSLRRPARAEQPGACHLRGRHDAQPRRRRRRPPRPGPRPMPMRWRARAASSRSWSAPAICPSPSSRSPTARSTHSPRIEGLDPFYPGPSGPILGL